MAVFYPMHERFGRVHAYLLDDGHGLTLVDGLGNRYAKMIFQELERIGRRPAEIRRIVLTHAHPTHVNGASVVKRVSGARVFAPVEEREIAEGRQPSGMTTWIPQRPYRVLLQQFLLNLSHVLWRLGWKVEVLNAVPVVVDHPIVADDEQIGPLVVIKTPGHSPGSTSYYWPETEVLFAGDAVVTWPRFELGWKGLSENVPENVRSVQSLVDKFEAREWRIRTIATGHGPPRRTDDGIRDLKELLARA